MAADMAACIVILLFIKSELSHESMHRDADRTYRVPTIDKALGTHHQRVGVTERGERKDVLEALLKPVNLWDV